jgi:chromosome partitioning protein
MMTLTSSPRVFAVATAKGGTGKTTTATNLSAALAARGHHVLLIDADPQANATRNLGLPFRHPEPQGLADVLLDNVPITDAAIAATNRLGVDLLPSTHRLARAELELPGISLYEMRLRRALADLPPQAYRYVVIDTHPGFSVLTRIAIAASNDVIVPTPPALWAMLGVKEMAEWVEATRKNLMLNGNGPRTYGAVLTIVERGTDELVQWARDRFGEVLLPQQFPKSRAAQWSENNNRPLLEAAGGRRLWSVFQSLAADIDRTEESYRASH